MQYAASNALFSVKELSTLPEVPAASITPAEIVTSIAKKQKTKSVS